MFSKPEKHYYVDMFLFMMGFVCIITGFLLKFKLISGISTLTLHEWTGYLLSAIIVIHLLMHSAWIKAVTKRLFIEKRALAGLGASIFLPIAICGAIIIFAPSQQNHFGLPNGQGFGEGGQGYGYGQNENGGGMNSGNGSGGNSYHGYGGYQGDGSSQGNGSYEDNQSGITSEEFQNWYYNGPDDQQSSSQDSAGIEM